MENDNSRLAGACYKWENGKWGWGSGEDRLYLRAAYIPNGCKWVLSDKYGNKCDTGGVSAADFWKVSFARNFCEQTATSVSLNFVLVDVIELFVPCQSRAHDYCISCFQKLAMKCC